MNLLYILRRARDLHTNEPALVEGDQHTTWAEFYRRVERSAAFLRGSGFAPGDRIAVLLSNSPTFLELYYATAMAGIAIVPLNTRWGAADFEFSLSDSGSKALIVDERFTATGRQIREHLVGLQLIYAGGGPCPEDMVDYHAGIRDSKPAVFAEPAPDDVAGIFYTSGTTGGPKGAMLTHRNLCSNAVLSYAFGLHVGAVYLHGAPMFHLADGAATHITTMCGSAHAFVDVFDAGRVLASIERNHVTSSVLISTMVNSLVNHPEVSRFNLSSLDRIVYGGSPMPVAMLRRAMDALGCRFQQAYGMTETSPVLTILQPEDHRMEDLDTTFAPVRSAGRPIIGMEVRVVDFADEPLPAGQVGEIVARGDNVMKGYWNRPQINSEVLRGGWMHTGDMGAFDENGFLYILDRQKDMIKTGGENVYSPEVESVIVAHADVLEAAVIGIPDERWGETIRAVVVLRPGARADQSDIIAHCRARMTHFKCPTSVIITDALPKGGTGKIQKQALRARFGGTASASA
jgi:long-chain acyl-CoA synthetase